jgi:hypothetical protein
LLERYKLVSIAITILCHILITRSIECTPSVPTVSFFQLIRRRSTLPPFHLTMLGVGFRVLKHSSLPLLAFSASSSNSTFSRVAHLSKRQRLLSLIQPPGMPTTGSSWAPSQAGHQTWRICRCARRTIVCYARRMVSSFICIVVVVVGCFQFFISVSNSYIAFRQLLITMYPLAHQMLSLRLPHSHARLQRVPRTSVEIVELRSVLHEFPRLAGIFSAILRSRFSQSIRVLLMRTTSVQHGDQARRLFCRIQLLCHNLGLSNVTKPSADRHGRTSGFKTSESSRTVQGIALS